MLLTGWLATGWRGTVCQSVADPDLTHCWHLQWNNRQHSSPAVPWAAKQDNPSHTINNMHADFSGMQHFFYILIFTLSVFCSPFLRQMLCERHNVTVAPGSEMWIHLTMQFKEIHIKRGAMKSTWDIVVILPCQKCQWRLRLNVKYFSHSCIYLLYLFTYLLLNLFFYLK